VEKFPEFHGNRRFITVFTTARHMALSWTRSTQSTSSQLTYLRLILILSSHLRLSRPSRLFASGFPTTTLYVPLLSPISATCRRRFKALYLITRIILREEYISWRKLRNFLQSPVTPLRPEYLPQYPVLEYSHPMFLPQVLENRFHSHLNIYSSSVR
jgi:hypothetical protein